MSTRTPSPPDIPKPTRRWSSSKRCASRPRALNTISMHTSGSKPCHPSASQLRDAAALCQMDQKQELPYRPSEDGSVFSLTEIETFIRRQNPPSGDCPLPTPKQRVLNRPLAVELTELHRIPAHQLTRRTFP